ncbi:MAG TPA: hypothetical protein VHB79_13535 [Polyangiaceae bacterium]|nr:hypothetical protein [Polyangiaceae bacterium]
MPTRAVLAALFLSLTACAAPSREVRRVWLPAYGFGAFGGGDVDVRDVCGSGRASEISVGSTWRTLAVSVVTLGVYTPREARLRCAPPR